MKQNKLLLSVYLTLISVLCDAQTGNNNTNMLENEKTYNIWTTYHLIFDKSEADELEIENYEFVKSLPQAAKVIIARYSVLVRDWDKETSHNLAQALGDFATLENAQNSLLAGWDDKQFADRGYTVYPSSLQMRKTDKSLFFEYPSAWRNENIVDEFKIDNEGHIIYVSQPEPIESIPYSRNELLDGRYGIYSVKINGERISRISFVILDPDNVESVGVNKRDGIVYITQKNTKPDYFVRTDLVNHLDSLSAFKVKKLKDVFFIHIKEESTGRLTEFTDNIKIETSAITSINSYVKEVGKHKYNGIVVAVK